MLAIAFPPVSPIAIDIGFLEIHWYSLAYIFGSIFALFYIKKLIANINFIDSKKQKSFFDDLMFYIVLGIILGGRLGFVLFYGMPYYLYYPFEIFYIWEGGMSFHGGLIGSIIACYLIAKKYNKHFLQITDIVAMGLPIGLFLGRIANFVNAELYGVPTNMPWGVIFPGDNFARHPSQLYEAFLEGLVLFFILLFMWRFKQYNFIGRISGFTLFFYSIFRISVEFVRQGEIYFFDFISMGQVLSLPMLIVGVYLIKNSYYAKK